MRATLDNLYARGFFRDRLFFAAHAVSAALQIAAWAFIAANLSVIHQPGREFIALHSKVFVGIDLYGQWQTIFAFPLGGLLVLLVNYVIGTRVYHESAHASTLLAITSVCVQAIILPALWSIIQINLY